MAKIPDPEEHRRRFNALSFAERRAIIRAVNRGRMVDARKHAPLAVVIARRQQRIWRWAWVLGPALGLFYLTVSWQVALINGAFSGLVLAMIARIWFLRAQRAEAANLALAAGRRREAESISLTGRAARRQRRDQRGGDGGRPKEGGRPKDGGRRKDGRGTGDGHGRGGRARGTRGSGG